MHKISIRIEKKNEISFEFSYRMTRIKVITECARELNTDSGRYTRTLNISGNLTRFFLELCFFLLYHENVEKVYAENPDEETICKVAFVVLKINQG